MKKLRKLIGRVCVGALAAGLTPYQIKLDKESRSFELRSLLWAVKKTPGEEKDNYTIELFPLLGGGKAPEEATAEAPEEAPVETSAEASEEAPAEPV